MENNVYEQLRSVYIYIIAEFLAEKTRNSIIHKIALSAFLCVKLAVCVK